MVDAALAARALAYEGYSYIALGETMCTTPINGGVPKTSSEMVADVITFASAVPATFDFRAHSSDNTTGLRTRVFERLTLGSNAFMLNTPFLAMASDPRVVAPAGRASGSHRPNHVPNPRSP